MTEIEQRPRMSRRNALKVGASTALALTIAGRANAAPVATDAASATAGMRVQTWRNWSGIQACTPEKIATPANEAALAELLRATGSKVRCVGAGHSFSGLVPTDGTLVSLDRMSGLISVDKAASTATLHGGTRLALLSRQLDQQGVGLRNLPDIDSQSFAGAIATATHGTGSALPALHAEVLGIRLMTADGNVVECNAKNNCDLFDAARVSLGALGVVTQVTVRTVPAYNLRRRVFLQPVEELLEAAPRLARQHRNFEFYYLPFTGYAAGIVHDIYNGSDVRSPSADDQMLRDLRRLRDWLSNAPQLRRWVASKFIDADQTEVSAGRSWKLLATQRATRFNETECHVPREAGIDCVREVIKTLEKRNDVFFPLEFRFVSADNAWLSPFHGRDSCSIAVHAPQGEPYDYLMTEIGPIFRKYNGRPHWGKLHNVGAAQLASLYPRWRDFLALRRDLDPRARLLNPYMQQLFGETHG